MTLNHAMIYTRDVERSLAFYRDLLGLTVLEEFRAGTRVSFRQACVTRIDPA